MEHGPACDTDDHVAGADDSRALVKQDMRRPMRSNVFGAIAIQNRCRPMRGNSAMAIAMYVNCRPKRDKYASVAKQDTRG